VTEEQGEFFNFSVACIIEQVSWNKSSLLLEIQKQNSQTLQLFTEIIEAEKYLQKLLRCDTGRLVCRDLVI
jgi:hypothetical protein